MSETKLNEVNKTNEQDSQLLEENYRYHIGKCCYCGDECNPHSQSCGSCARLMTGISLGWVDESVQKYFNISAFELALEEKINNLNNSSLNKDVDQTQLPGQPIYNDSENTRQDTSER